VTARKIYRIEIPAKPQPKQRPTVTRQGRAFTPKQTVNAEAWVRLCCTQQVGTPLVPGPVTVRLAFVMPIPGSMPRREKADAIAGRKQPTTKPDWDNLAKLTADALNGIAWRDDAHVTVAEVAKFYGDTPRTIIEWWQASPEESALLAMRWGISPAAELL
jgi:Holliday junction resolvase RusA-like endonuclease